MANRQESELNEMDNVVGGIGAKEPLYVVDGVVIEADRGIEIESMMLCGGCGRSFSSVMYETAGFRCPYCNKKQPQ